MTLEPVLTLQEWLGVRHKETPVVMLCDEPTCNLDSNNGAMVMDLLQALHAEGATMCMVTHDLRCADRARRTIHLFDGKVVDGAASIP